MPDAGRPHATLDLPNVLTLVRAPCALLVWLRPSDPTWVLALMAIAGFTDLVDGAAARWLRRRRGRAPRAERLGSWLDPACDKLFVLSAVVAATIFYPHPWPLPLLLAVRELVMVPVVIGHRMSQRLGRPAVDYTAGTLGKLTTILQFGTLVAWILLHPAALPLASAAALVGFATAVVYLRRGHQEVVRRERRDGSGGNSSDGDG